jgi:hypothetical protein
MKDVAESKRVGKLVRAGNKQCYYNAFHVVMNIPEYAYADYVEGMAVLNGLPIEHGWVEKEGGVIDPTWPERKAVYFPGLRFHGCRELAEALRIPKPEYIEDFPIFHRFGWGGIGSPDFRAACIAAYRHAGMAAAARVYEEYKPEAEMVVVADCQ